MKRRSKQVLLVPIWLVIFVTLPFVATGLEQGERSSDQEYWVDPSTELMWTKKDNGRDINWRGATKYCRELRLGGFSDWRLGAIEELEGIFDRSARAPGLGAGKRGDKTRDWHVKGDLFLTGDQWSGTRRMDISGRPSGLVWYFDFWNKHRGSEDGSRFSGRLAGGGKRALCVRRPGS